MSEPSSEHEKGGKRKKRMAPLAFILLLGLSLVVFVSNVSLLAQIDAELPLHITVLFFIVTMIASVKLSSGTPDEKSTKGVPRAAIKLLLTGLGLVSLGFIVFFAGIAFLPYEKRTSELFYLFVNLVMIGLGVVFAGRIVAEITYSHRRFRVPPKLMESLRGIEPDASFETDKFYVFRKGVIFILLRKFLWGVHFIKLFQSHPVSSKNVKAPFVRRWNWARSLKFEVNGLRMAKERGEFTIPVNIVKLGWKTEVKYNRGAGILYYISLYPVGRFSVNQYGENLSGKLDKPTIVKILDDLSNEKAVGAPT